MKLLSIINKNLKVVSRNWNYFVVLVLCPIILILASGAMLNSSDVKNLKIGIINEEGMNLNFNEENTEYYGKLSNCLSGISSEAVSACIRAYKANDLKQMDVYLDNSNKRIESYTKQFVLEQISSMQSEAIEQAGEMVYSELGFLTTSINHAKLELEQAYNEIDSLEKDLIDYKAELSGARKDFDEIYYAVKNIQSKLNLYKPQIEQAKKDIQDFNDKKGRIENSINSIRSQLESQGHHDLVLQLDSILTELDSIENSLNMINTALNNYETASRDLDSIIIRLDNMKALLDRLDADLQKNIEKTEETKSRIRSFILELEEGRIQITQFSQSVGLENTNLEFKNSYEIRDDPILVSFPLLVAIIISFTAIILSNLFISKQINHPSFLRDLISPTGDIHFLIANYLVTLFFVALQIIFLFIVGHFWFNINVLNNLIYSVPLMILIASMFVFIGMSIGYIVKSQYLSMLLSIFIVVFCFIFSDLLTPAILTSSIVKFFVSINPFALFSNGLMNIIILNKPISFQSNIFYRLEILFAITLLIYFISKKICNLKTNG